MEEAAEDIQQVEAGGQVCASEDVQENIELPVEEITMELGDDPAKSLYAGDAEIDGYVEEAQGLDQEAAVADPLESASIAEEVRNGETRNLLSAEDWLLAGDYYYEIQEGKAIIRDVVYREELDKDGRVTKRDKLQYTDVNVPQTLGGCPVTRIGDKVFANAKNLQRVVLPDSLEEIGVSAFENCEQLMDVNLPRGLKLLDRRAFANCTSLGSIWIPAGMNLCQYSGWTSYDGPFKGCTALKQVSFEAGIETIQPALFDGCRGLEEIVIPEGVVTIKHHAFRGCEALVKIDLPDSLKTIEGDAFEGCNSLKEIHLPPNLEMLGNNAFKKCAALEKANIPSGVRTGEYVGHAGYPGPFEDCDNLHEVHIDPGTTVISPGILRHCLGLREVAIPEGVSEIGRIAFENCENLEKVELPASLKMINNGAFRNCTSLIGLHLPQGLETLGEQAFAQCSTLYKADIPGTLRVGFHAFCNCANLGKITFLGDVEAIPNGIFYKCEALKQIELPETVTVIGREAFNSCTALKEIYLGGKLSKVEYAAFDGCGALKKVRYGAEKAQWKKVDIEEKNDPLRAAKFNYAKKKSLSKAKVSVKNCTYTGEELHPKVTVKLGKKTLKKDKDYRVEYQDNCDPGDGRVIVTGMGVYTGTAEATFKIRAGQSYLVTFDTQNKKVAAPDPIRVIKGKPYGGLPSVTRKGYALEGWYTSAKGGSRITNETKVTKKSGHTLYAHWIKEYTVKYVLDKGVNHPENPSVFTGKTSFTLKNPARPGYTFSGWYLDKSHKNRVKTIGGQTGNITLYAMWRKATSDGSDLPGIYSLCIGGVKEAQNDVELIAKRLKTNKLKGYSIKAPVTTITERFEKSFLDRSVKYAFKGSTKQDICIIYLCTHGKAERTETGAEIPYGLDATDGYYRYADVLNMLSKNIPGHIVLLTEVCYSGGFVEAAKSETYSARNRITVIAASDKYKGSENIGYTPDMLKGMALGIVLETVFDIKVDKGIGRFTQAIDKGLKGNKADGNGTGVSVDELFAYITSDKNVSAVQTPAFYSSNKSLVIYQS